MTDNYKKLLKEMGFNTELKGAEYFISVVTQLQETLLLIDGDFKKIPGFQFNNGNIIYNYIDSLFVEDYAFSYECGRKQYLKDMDDFLNSRVSIDEQQEELYSKIFGKLDNRELKILNFAKYLNENNQELFDDKKNIKKV